MTILLLQRSIRGTRPVVIESVGRMETPHRPPVPSLAKRVSVELPLLEKLSRGTPSVDEITVARPILQNLPVEIFMRVVDFLSTAKDIINLSHACTKLNLMGKEHAWRRFVLSQFPTLTYALQTSASNVSQRNIQLHKNGPDAKLASTSSDLSGITPISGLQWEHLAKTLTSQSRAWDRRAFTVSRLAPLFNDREDIEHSPTPPKSGHITRYEPENGTFTKFVLDKATRGPASGAQTTGYHPLVDAKLEFRNCLHDKKETVAWSTGAKVFLRVRQSGSFNPSEKKNIATETLLNDAYNNITNVACIIHEDYREGFDDVLTLNIVPSTAGLRATQNGFVVDVIIGRASGHLNRFSINMCPALDSRHGFSDEYDKVIVNTFVPGSKRGPLSRSGITSLDVYGDEASYLACTSEGFLSLYRTESFTHDIEPLDEIEVENGSQNKTRAVKFLSHEKVVVGIERHHQALRTFQITPDGLRLIDKLSTIPHEEVNQTESGGQGSMNSIYALEPVSNASRPGGNLNGDVFLSGWYDGRVRLYDLRASGVPVACYGEENDSSVYSLATYGQERFVAGTARSKVQIFDFRLGNKVYSYTEALPCSSKKADDTEKEIRKLCHPTVSYSLGNKEYSYGSHSYHESKICFPQFPSRLHNTFNFQRLGNSIMGLQRSCSNVASKAQAQCRQLRPELSGSDVFPSLEALYKQESFAEQTLWHAAPDENEKRKNPPTVWEDCRFDLREEPSRRCNFHKDAGHNKDTNVFLYGLHPRRRNNYSTLERPREDRLESPIFSLASPSPVSPILYIGALGTVYEMAVCEFGAQAQTTDPYFNDAPYTLQTNTLTNLSMYEVDDEGELKVHYQRLKHTVERRAGDLRVSEKSLGDSALVGGTLMKVRNAEGRLDRRWVGP